MFLISNAYAQTAATASSDSGFSQFFIIIPMFVVLYFVMIRPQMKRAKEQKELLSGIAKGDEVVTVGGMTGGLAPDRSSFAASDSPTSKPAARPVSVRCDAM